MDLTSSLSFYCPRNMRTCAMTIDLNNTDALNKKKITSSIDSFDTKLFTLSLQRPKFIPKQMYEHKNSFVYYHIGDINEHSEEKFDNLITHKAFKSSVPYPKIEERLKLHLLPKEDYFAHRPMKKSGKIKIESDIKYLDDKILKEEIKKSKKENYINENFLLIKEHLENSKTIIKDNSISHSSNEEDVFAINRPKFVTKLFEKYNYDDLQCKNQGHNLKYSAQRNLNYSVIKSVYNKFIY